MEDEGVRLGVLSLFMGIFHRGSWLMGQANGSTPEILFSPEGHRAGLPASSNLDAPAFQEEREPQAAGFLTSDSAEISIASYRAAAVSLVLAVLIALLCVNTLGNHCW